MISLQAEGPKNPCPGVATGLEIEPGLPTRISYGYKLSVTSDNEEALHVKHILRRPKITSAVMGFFLGFWKKCSRS